MNISEVTIYTIGAVALAITAAIIQGHLSTAIAVSASKANPPPILMAVVFAPLAESIVFQGWVQSTFEKWFDGWWALALTIIPFLAIHLSVSAPLLASVFALSFIRMRTHSLGTVIIAHAAINLSMYALT